MQVLRNAVLVVSLLLSQRVLAEPGWRSIGDLVRVEERANQVELSAQGGKVRIIALAPDVVRVTYAPGGTFPQDQSFAVLPDAFPAGSKLRVSKGAGAVELRTDLLVIRVDESPLRITFLDASGKVLSQEWAEYPAAFNGTEFRVWKSMPEDEHYFGLGDKTGPARSSRPRLHDVEHRCFRVARVDRSLIQEHSVLPGDAPGNGVWTIPRQHLSQQL